MQEEPLSVPIEALFIYKISIQKNIILINILLLSVIF